MRHLIALAVAAGALAPVADAQAYCALRDPNRQIYELFPEADSYRSIVRTVDNDAREAIGERLPFTLHFNELGRHTLYVAQRGSDAIGLIHVRSEAGRWGLVEVAWALDLDLEVVDFAFQRCRDRNKDAFLDAGVRAQIVGAGFRELRALINRTGDGLAPGALPLDGDASDLGAVVVRNALKTIAATETAWRGDVWDLRSRAIVGRLAPDCERLSPVPAVHSDAVLDELDRAVGVDGTGIVRNEVLAWSLADRDGKGLGSLVAARWKQAPIDVEVLWLVGTDGALAAVEAVGGWPSVDVAAAFDALVGQDVDALCDCAGAVELAALEVLVTLDVHAR